MITTVIMPDTLGNKYSKEIGYSSLESVDIEKKKQEVQNCKKIIISYYEHSSKDRILVAGAGGGEEPRIVSEEFKIDTIGVDINTRFQNPKRKWLYFSRQDLLTLGFEKNIFSLIYCYHVLEHVQNPERVLYEFHRVLKPGGILFIGFPNKKRLFSYFGTSQSASIKEKIIWNINDYIFKMKGKFENRYGAHAGFTEKEFINLSTRIFHNVFSERNQYMLNKYSKHKPLILFMIKSGISEVFFPSNYFICRK